VAHDDNLTRQIAICNDSYKFTAFLYNILQEFTIDNKVIVTSHSETVRKLHDWRTNFEMILKRIASITYELNIPWDPGFGSAFTRDDLLLLAACAFFELSSFAVSSSRRLAPPPPL